MSKADITFQNNEFIFNFRVSCVIQFEDRTLLHKKQGDGFWNLIGGRVKIGENSEQAIIREIKEELGCECEVKKAFKFSENFFEFQDKKYHEILLIYRVKLEEKAMFNQFQDKLIFQWFTKEELEKLTIKPYFTKELLLNNNDFGWRILNEEF